MRDYREKPEESALTGWAISGVGKHCPYCGAPIELLIDPSDEGQQYIEDCQVCCRPMVVRILAMDPIELSLGQEDDA